MLKSTHLLFLVLVSNFVFCQADTIRLKNPSFEDTPKRGGEAIDGITGWFDCGKIIFQNETPPDIHPSGFWENNVPALDKKTYLGMVVRDNFSYESVSVRLDSVLKAQETYSLSIYLARSPSYFSKSRLTGEEVNYITPAVLRIWGGTGYCNERHLIYESPPIDHNEWKKYDILFKPKQDCKSITIAAYYTKNTNVYYNGHVLVDGISDIIRKK
jgi:hypothetical protein